MADRNVMRSFSLHRDRRHSRAFPASLTLIFSICFFSFASNRSVRAAAGATSGTRLIEPAQALEHMRAESEEQIRSIRNTAVLHEFRFTDRHAASRIGFEHRVVEDAGKFYKPVHYDHGNGIAAADVDGDGRTDLYFTTQLGTNQLWRNSGNGEFTDITATAGVGLASQISVGASFADIDNDGDPDLFVTTVRKGNHLFRNEGGGRFVDVTEEAGLGYVGHSSGAVFFDYDNDGRLDLFLCNVGVYTTDKQGPGGYYVGLRDGFSGHTYPERRESSILYRNADGIHFKDVSREMGLVDFGWNGDATFTDLDGDHFPELYVLNMQGDDHYYANRAGKRFEESTAARFPRTPWGAMGIKFFDFNQDGRLDLFITDMHSDMTEIATRASKTNLTQTFAALKADPWCATQYTEEYLQGSSNNIFGNALYLNQGSGFDEVSEKMGAETFWPWGLSVADLNADGYEDAFVTAGMGFGFRYGINSLLLNDGGRRFVSAEYALGIEPRAEGRIRKVAFVLECSGADRSHPLCSGQSGRVPVFESTSSRSSVVFDLEGDGDLDIVTLEMNDRPQVLVSDLAGRVRPRFLELRLVGTQSNRDGLGALVRVNVGDRQLTQYHDGKSGYFGQSSLPLYFGLGTEGELRSVEVIWPSGIKQVVNSDLRANSLLVVTEKKE